MPTAAKPPTTRKTKTKPKADGNRQTSLFDSFLTRTSTIALPAASSSETGDGGSNGLPLEPDSTERVTEYLRLTSLEPTPDPALQPSTSARVPSLPVAPLSIDHSVIEIADSSPIEERPAPLPTSQGSVHDPIVITASPVKSRAQELAPRPPINSFFAPRPAKTKLEPSPAKSKQAQKGSYDVPYPTAESQHVRGEQHTFPVAERSQKYRQPPEKSVLNGKNTGLPLELRHVIFSSVWDEKISRQVLPNIQRHTISQVYDVSETLTPSQKLWTEKWRPTRADQVLGNEENAIYLRDWLHALELQLGSDSGSRQVNSSEAPSALKDTKKKKEISKKRPRVIRAVEKKKKKRRTEWDDEDDWIVDDEFYSEDPILDSEGWENDEAEFVPPATESTSVLPHGPAQDANPRLEFKAKAFDSLTNTILLAGSSGIGKTASVYACAEELGWEVFEVYPGIGRRNGAGIETLVGEVGKNHHVKTKSGAGKLTGTPMGFFGKTQPTETEQASSEKLSDGGAAILSEAEATPGARQSLVLLEEVDILFKEDAGFWPSVIDFIKSCKRPVICTCNDVSAVPTADLPLQATLIFQPCPSEAAASFLHDACTSEGYNVDTESLRRLYESPPPGCLPSSPLVFPEIIPQPDLRRTIYHLQLQCSTLCPTTQSLDILLPPTDLLNTTFYQTWSSLEPHQKIYAQERNTPSTFSRNVAANHADLVSFTDSYLLPRKLELSENANVHENVSSADDEVDCPHAVSSDNSWFPLGSISDEKSDMACTALLLSRGILEKELLTGSTSMDDSMDRFGPPAMFRDRMDYQEQISTALERLVPQMQLATRRSDVYSDYVPFIREIISGEDTQEELELLKDKPGRLTRNSIRSRYERSITITPEQRAALSVTAFSRTL